MLKTNWLYIIFCFLGLPEFKLDEHIDHTIGKNMKYIGNSEVFCEFG